MISIDGVDEKEGVVYFSGNLNDCKQRHLIRASFSNINNNNNNNSFSTITTREGWHSSIVNTKFNIIADVFCSVHSPIVFSVYKYQMEDNFLELVTTVLDNTSAELQERDARTRNEMFGPSLRPPVFYSFPSGDGNGEIYHSITIISYYFHYYYRYHYFYHHGCYYRYYH